MNLLRSASLLALASCALSASALTFNVDPRGSYLRASGEAPLNPLVIDLAATGFHAGQSILLTQLGLFYYNPSRTATANRMSAVFSSDSTLLGASNLNRIPGAIDAGSDFESLPSRLDGASTDISQDFEVLSIGTRIAIPTDARYLFVAARDSYYSDNSIRFATNYAVGIRAVPGPAAALPFALMALRRRKRA